jgi:hypothetical protein
LKEHVSKSLVVQALQSCRLAPIIFSIWVEYKEFGSTVLC